MTQQEFLSDPKICTKEVLRQILDAAKGWVADHDKNESWNKLAEKGWGRDEDLLIKLTEVDPLRFCVLSPFVPGEPNPHFLMICLEQMVPQSNKPFEVPKIYSDKIVKVSRDLLLSLFTQVQKQEALIQQLIEGRMK